MGDLGGVPPAGCPWADNVRPDDRRVVDLHRDPGNLAGNLRDLRRNRGQAPRRQSRRHGHAHCRARRDGRRSADGGHDERWRRAVCRSRSVTDPAAPGHRLPRCPRQRRRRRAQTGNGGETQPPGAVDRRPGQRGRHRAPPARDRGRHRRRHRPDLGARPADVRPCWRERGRDAGPQGQRPRRAHEDGQGVDGPARRGDGRLPRLGGRGVRLRQLDPRRGDDRWLRTRLRLSRLRSRVHPTDVLRRQGPVPVGSAVRRPAGHRRDGPGRARRVPGQRVARPVDQDGR